MAQWIETAAKPAEPPGGLERLQTYDDKQFAAIGALRILELEELDVLDQPEEPREWQEPGERQEPGELEERQEPGECQECWRSQNSWKRIGTTGSCLLTRIGRMALAEKTLRAFIGWPGHQLCHRPECRRCLQQVKECRQRPRRPW